MNSDKEVSKKLNAAIERISKEEPSLSKQEAYTKAAGELGYTFNVGEFERLSADKKELSDEELDRVAGGKCGFFIPDLPDCDFPMDYIMDQIC